MPAAPNWVRRLRMEWLYRLLNEPRRLLKRYSWGLAVFFRVCLQSGKQLGRPGTEQSKTGAEKRCPSREEVSETE